MSDAIADKWVQDLHREDPTSAAAAHTLRSRLGAVRHYLPLAAREAEEDVEYVHQLRVWTRRATAALRLYEEWLPRRRFAWMKKQLKRIRRAANEARDCDVLLERLRKKTGRGSQRWRESVRAERVKAQEAIIAVEERLGRDRLERRITKLLERVRCRLVDGSGAEPPFGRWARQRLRPLVARFFEAIPSDHTNEAALHQLRIRGKELRYAVELLSGAFPDTLRTQLYPLLEEIQDRLGAINDLATARMRLQEKTETAATSAEAGSWRRLLAAEQTQLEQARQEFWQWCTPQRLQELRSGLKALFPQPTPVVPPGNGRAAGINSPPTLPVGNNRPDSPTIPKAHIIHELGEEELLLPARVNEALAANDRAKYWMTLLQQAREHADHPELAVTDLKQERLACAIAESDLDTVVDHSHKEDTDLYHIPSASQVHGRLVDEIRRMLAPLHAGTGPAGTNDGLGVAKFDRRLQTLLAQAPAPAEDRLSGSSIDRLTSGRREAGDSMHLLVMDLHKELNRLQQQLATENIAGASVYGLVEDDGPLIAAFMAGVNQTRALKFDHPGLGTTATRSGQRLVIQNDLGETQAHVLVVQVEGMRVNLTYSDIHIDRLVFFQNLFDRYPVQWKDTVSRRAAGLREDLYHLCLGTYEARDREDLLAYLTFLGSRLVFLIDWNRARKRLRKFAPRRVCLEVLRWAVDHQVGHRGFLALGGEQLIFDALQAAGRLPLPPGGQLSDFLGPERTAEFLKFTLQTATEGLRANRSELLIRDEICVELRHYIDTAHQRLLEVAAEHASLIVELAMAVRDLLLTTGPAADRDLVQRIVLRGRTWEHRADELVNRCRTAHSRGDAPGPILDLLITADDVADSLEEALYRVSLLQSGEKEGSGSGTPPLGHELPALVVQGAQEYLKAVENARSLHRASPREQVADFLEAVDRIMTVEHQTDDAHRRAQAGILSFAGDFKQWSLTSGVADKLEEAADFLMRSVLVLRDYILGEVLRR